MRSQLELLKSLLHGLESRLKAPEEKLRIQRLQLQKATLRLKQSMLNRLHLEKEKYSILAGQLDVLSPLAVLGRGYAIVRKIGTDTLVKDPQQVVCGDQLRLQLAKGELSAVVVSETEEKAK